MIAKTLRVEKYEYYTIHLSIVNCFLPVKLKPKEIEVLSQFMTFDDSAEFGRFNSQNRKVVRNRLNISHGGLSNYIISLKEKGFLIGEKNDLVIISLLHPNNKEQDYNFKLINIDSLEWTNQQVK